MPVPDSKDLIGMAWLYALHVRSSIARSRLLQAEYMLSGMRDNVLALMCKHHGVAAVQGRGLDDLTEEQKARAAECLARSLEPVELKRAFRLTVGALLEEVRYADSGLATKLEGTLRSIVNCLALTGVQTNTVWQFGSTVCKISIALIDPVGPILDECKRCLQQLTSG